jgi:uncharacterized glyoxalase superfamily metalloenzyme YdcJ
MSAEKTITSNKIRQQFSAALSAMYKEEVPQYARMLALVEEVNKAVLENKKSLFTEVNLDQLNTERHGAIRLGTSEELFTMRRLFAVMGMQPVDYYDLSVAGIPVHSTAFRPLSTEDLQQNSFRIFTSLLRLDLIDDRKLREEAQTILAKRNIFSSRLIILLEQFEVNGGLNKAEANTFIGEALEVFRWHQKANVDKKTYLKLKKAHGLIADIVSFKGPHINHLTPQTLDIDQVQLELSRQGFKAKAVVEGPPTRKCPILLRQTSFLALEEEIEFSDGKSGTHTARFGEIEQRGLALTSKGRDLYDKLIQHLHSLNIDPSDYPVQLAKTFLDFPDNHKALYDQGLAYYANANSGSDQQVIDRKPIIYEDFLPVSAAGIFKSNLNEEAKQEVVQSSQKEAFEKALGVSLYDSFKLYDSVS